MFKTNARTKTASALTASGDRLRLETPQFMAQCLTDRVPYVMPDSAGGYVLIAEYGDPCPAPVVIDKPTGCGCSGGCADASKCNKPKNCEKQVSRCEQPNRAGLERDDEDRLLRFEIAKYSGYEADGVTLILTQRGVEGTIKQDWPLNTLVMQVMTGAELKDVYSSINGVKSFLDSLGCILAVPRNPDGACGGWNAGEWACFGGQFYRSKENGNCTTAPSDKWDGGFDLYGLLNMYLVWIIDCNGDRIPFGEKVATCKNLNDLYESIVIYIRNNTCDIAVWSSGTTAHIVKGSDKKYYKANTAGKPSISDPVTQNINQANWFGGYATICELQQRHFGISAASGNLLQWREDGVYYGVEAPPNVAVQYVDAINGVDTEFTAIGEARGTRELPVKTITFALDRLPFGSNGAIHLHEDQDHYVNDYRLRSNNITFNPYGDVYDSLKSTASCPGYYVVIGSYRYRNFKPRIVAKRCWPYPDIPLSETCEALAPAPSYKFSTNGIVLVSGDAACATADKPIDVNRSSFGGWGGIAGGWDLYFSEVWLHTIAAFNSDVVARGTFYLKRLTSAQTPFTVKSEYQKNVSIPYNFIDRPALPPVPVSPCDTDYSGIQDDIDIPSLFSGFGDPQEMVVGLSTNIPNSVIRP